MNTLSTDHGAAVDTTTISSTVRSSRMSTALARLSMLCMGFFTALVLALHVLRFDLNPVTHFVSEYAVGSFGMLMTVAFLAWSCGTLALAVAFLTGKASAPRSWLGTIMLSLWGVVLTVCAIFPTDLQTIQGTSTPSGQVHDQAALIGFLSVMVASIAISRRFKRDLRWASLSRPAMALSLSSILAFVLFFAGIAMGMPGLPQRLFIGIVVAWSFVVARRLSIVASNTEADS